MKTLQEMKKGLKEFLSNINDDGGLDTTNEEIISYFSTSLQELLEQVVPEEKKFAEKESDDFDDGYELCRQEVEDRIKKILNN